MARFDLLSDNLSPAGTSIWLYKTKIEKVKHGLRWTSYGSSSVPSSPGMWFSLVESSVSEPLLLNFLPSGVGFTIITGQAQFCAQYSLTLPRKTLCMRLRPRLPTMRTSAHTHRTSLQISCFSSPTTTLPLHFIWTQTFHYQNNYLITSCCLSHATSANRALCGIQKFRLHL
jgi:hypothetical protein